MSMLCFSVFKIQEYSLKTQIKAYSKMSRLSSPQVQDVPIQIFKPGLDYLN